MSEVFAWSSALVALAWIADSASGRLAAPCRLEVKRSRTWLQWWAAIAPALLIGLCAAALLLDMGTIHAGPVEPPIRLAGLLLAIAAFVVSARARVELGDSYACDLRVWSGQQLVVKGLYSLVRHPCYFGTLTMWLATGLAMLSWSVLASGMLLIAPTFYLLARREEELMLEHFGSAYGEYQARVPMLCPWPRPTTTQREDAVTVGSSNQDEQGEQDARVEEV